MNSRQSTYMRNATAALLIWVNQGYDLEQNNQAADMQP